MVLGRQVGSCWLMFCTFFGSVAHFLVFLTHLGFFHRFVFIFLDFSLIPLNSPRGGPPPPPHLCARMLADCHALKACICRTALLKAHGEMKAHILVTICPDFGTWHSWLFWHTRHFVCEVTTSKKRTPKRHEFKTEPTKPNLLVRNTFLPTFCRKIAPGTF